MLAISIAIPVPVQGTVMTSATQIASATDLAAFRNAVNSGKDYAGETVTLTADITVTGWETSIGIKANNNDQNKPFLGTFDGQGHKITLTGSASLFAVIGKANTQGGIVQNLGVKATITGKITGNYNSIGGIVEYSLGTVQNCYTEGAITNEAYYTGGIVAYNAGIVQNCYSTASCTANNIAGGIAGYNSGTIQQCYATGAITGGAGSNAGGIAGSFSGQNITLKNCIALNTGGITAGTKRRVGAGGTLSGNFASPLIPGEWTDKGADKNDGEDLTEATFIGKGAGEGAFAGWDADAWDFGDNTRLPKLKGFTGTQPADGITRESVMPKPLITSIASAEDLAAFRDTVNNGADYAGMTVTLKRDITLSGDWTPIGNYINRFAGTFEGGGHCIKDLKVEIEATGNQYGGLFGYIDTGGTVQNLGVKGTVSVTSTSSFSCAGGIAGHNQGTIKNCFTAVEVKASSNDGRLGYAGGITGLNQSGISNCYTTGSTTSDCYAGGIAGSNFNSASSNISYCYATGKVISDNYATGIAYDMPGVTHCIALNMAGIEGNSTRYRVSDQRGTNNYASPLIPGTWADKAADQPNGADLTEANFIGQGAGEGAFTGWTDESWSFGTNANLPKLMTTGLTTTSIISGQGKNMPARIGFLEPTAEIITAVTYEEAKHKDYNILVKDGGIFTIATDNASFQKLTIEDGGQVVADKAFTCAKLLAPRVLGNQWTAYGSPVYMNAVATTSQKFYRLSGYKSQSNQSWNSNGNTTGTSYSIAALNLIATDANDVPVTLTAPNTGSDPVTLPADTEAPTGEDLYTGIFLFRANPTLKNVEIPMAYILSDDGTRFERTENAVVKPFQSYMVANAATMRSVTSLRAGGIPTANEAVALPDGTFRVWGGDGQLHLSADKPSDVAIYDADGRLVQRLALTGERTLSLGRGIYFVHSNNITYKVSL